MSGDVKFTAFSAFVCLDDWSVHMHEEFVLFPGPRSDIKKCYFVGPSVFVFDSELVPFKEVVLGRNELDS